MKTVFLGGTCNGSLWRESLIPMLTNVNYFNPVVPEWNSEAQAREITARETSEYVLYVITPKMTGFYSIAEVVDDSNKRPDKTIMAILNTDGGVEFTSHQLKSLLATKKLVIKNGGQAFDSLQEVANYLNA